MERIKIKYLQADFPVHIINEVYHRSNQERDELLIPQLLFDDRKECLIRLLLAPANEKFVKSFKSWRCLQIIKLKFNIA